jgi:hypothetical protein
MARVWRDGQRKECSIYRFLTTGARWSLCKAFCLTTLRLSFEENSSLSQPYCTTDAQSTLRSCAGTIDEKIYQRQLQKGELADAMHHSGGNAKEGRFTREQLRQVWPLTLQLHSAGTAAFMLMAVKHRLSCSPSACTKRSDLPSSMCDGAKHTHASLAELLSR